LPRPWHLTWDSIFIGGACTQFYVEDPSLHDFRPTNDIDCIVKVYSYKEFDVCSEELRKLGFAHDTSEGAPIVRWIYKGILVDILLINVPLLAIEISSGLERAENTRRRGGCRQAK